MMCHDLYDGRDNSLTRNEKRTMFRECYPKTMVRVAEKLSVGELKLVQSGKTARKKYLCKISDSG